MSTSNSQTTGKAAEAAKAEADKQAAEAAKAKKTYVCNTACEWMKRYWRKGDTCETVDTPPQWFTLIDK